MGRDIYGAEQARQTANHNASFIANSKSDISYLLEQVAGMRKMLEKACASVENQANWDKPPYSGWYYEARALLDHPMTEDEEEYQEPEEDDGEGPFTRSNPFGERD